MFALLAGIIASSFIEELENDNLKTLKDGTLLFKQSNNRFME